MSIHLLENISYTMMVISYIIIVAIHWLTPHAHNDGAHDAKQEAHHAESADGAPPIVGD